MSVLYDVLNLLYAHAKGQRFFSKMLSWVSVAAENKTSKKTMLEWHIFAAC